MIQALAISSSTVVRATVIAQRTNSEEIGIIKAMMIAQLKEKLANGVAHFIFIKKNGEVREAWGTTNPSLSVKHINGNGISKGQHPPLQLYSENNVLSKKSNISLYKFRK